MKLKFCLALLFASVGFAVAGGLVALSPLPPEEGLGTAVPMGGCVKDVPSQVRLSKIPFDHNPETIFCNSGPVTTAVDAPSTIDAAKSAVQSYLNRLMANSHDPLSCPSRMAITARLARDWETFSSSTADQFQPCVPWSSCTGIAMAFFEVTCR